MLLWYKEGIEIPKTTLDKARPQLATGATPQKSKSPIGRHFFETHLKEDLPEFMSHFID